MHMKSNSFSARKIDTNKDNWFKRFIDRCREMLRLWSMDRDQIQEMRLLFGQPCQ
jgi:hypothetical protein